MSCSRLRSKLSGLLQAETMQYGQLGRVGTRVSTRRLAAAMVSPRADIFLRKRPQRGADTHVLLLLDASGSMRGEPMKVASAALYMAALACQHPGVVTSAYAFNSHQLSELLAPRCRPNPARMFTEPAGSTPLFEAAIDVLTRFDPQCSRRILVIITDGYPDSQDALMTFSGLVQAMNVDVVGIGIQSDYLAQLLPADKVGVINNVREFPDTLTSLLLRMLTGRR